MKFNDQFEMASLITMKTDEVKQTLGGSYIMRTFERKTRLDKHIIFHIRVSGTPSNHYCYLHICLAWQPFITAFN